MARSPLRKIYAHAELRRLRTGRGTTQVELARALGISTSNGPAPGRAAGRHGPGSGRKRRQR
ncbi:MULTISPECIES: helix-turn-helix domain-containing protein [Streptomyces]|uniref:hypothetical protein n=1 Tax=Streptomyces TaxID=1883 RepID=UPI00144E3A49|nr:MULTISPECIES: hypothetical protein [Streptomyces]MYV88872.1 hypothetical protein [Streptomyces sp. SID1034]